MVRYTAFSCVPVTCEDFRSRDPKYPSVTLHSRSGLDPDFDTDLIGEKVGVPLPHYDGWVDMVLDVPEIDQESALLALAEITGLPLSQIEIEYKGEMVAA